MDEASTQTPAHDTPGSNIDEQTSTVPHGSSIDVGDQSSESQTLLPIQSETDTKNGNVPPASDNSGMTGGAPQPPAPQKGPAGDGTPTSKEMQNLVPTKRELDEEKKLVNYLSNGNKSKLMTSGLLNTAALSTNASLLALIMKLQTMNPTAVISLCLIILSVFLQLMTAFFTILEFRAGLIVDKDPEKLWRGRALRKTKNRTKTAMGTGSSNETSTTPKSSYLFCKPMELQFLIAFSTMVLTAVNTFIIALTSNIKEDLVVTPAP